MDLIGGVFILFLQSFTAALLGEEWLGTFPLGAVREVRRILGPEQEGKLRMHSYWQPVRLLP